MTATYDTTTCTRPAPQSPEMFTSRAGSRKFTIPDPLEPPFIHNLFISTFNTERRRAGNAGGRPKRLVTRPAAQPLPLHVAEAVRTFPSAGRRLSPFP